jgi:hypothetical protein
VAVFRRAAILRAWPRARIPRPSARRTTSADVLGALRDWTGGFNAGRYRMAGLAAAVVVGILLLNRYGQRQMPGDNLRRELPRVQAGQAAR